MDEIKELIKIITYNTKKNFPLLDLKNQIQNGNKEMNLFLGIKNGDFTTDEDASKVIYGSNEVDFKFRMLKSRLSRKLLNHLFFVDFAGNGYPKATTHYQEALDYLHFSRMLIQVGEISLGTKLLQKTIDIARDGEYTVILLDSLRELRDIYSKTHRPKLFQSIKTQLSELEALERIEERANAIFQEQRLSICGSVTNRKKSWSSLADSVSEIKELYKQSDSYNIFEKFLQLQIWHFELTGKFEQLLRFISGVERDFRNGLINKIRYEEAFINRAKCDAIIVLKRVNEGSQFLEKMLLEVNPSTNEWFLFAEKYVMLLIQIKDFEKATEVFARVLANKSLDELQAVDLLKWNLIRGYLYLLTSDKKLIKKFDFEEFVAHTPEFAKDKSGLHVALLIMQILHLPNRNINTLNHKLYAIDEYVSRHLNNSFSKRTKIFCKLLHKIAEYNYDYETIIAKSRYLQEKLKAAEPAAKTYIDLEIVPYDFLWDWILKKIKA